MHRNALLFALTLNLLGAQSISAVHVSENDVPVETGVEVASLTDSLEFPWGFDWLPDGRAVITEQAGSIRVFDGESVSTRIPFPVEVTSGGAGGITRGQGGLMDVAAGPDFAQSGWLYFTYSSGDPDANRTVLARSKLKDSELVDLEILWQNPIDKRSGQHFGSRILFLPDGTLLLTVGDGGNPPVSYQGEEIRQQAQNLASAFGKVLRLNPDGSIPADNPSFDESSIPGLWSYGHRNIQGIARDSETGEIWANEHGAFLGDELNRLEGGGNFGWPAATYSVNYRGRTPISDHRSLPGMIDPVLVWMQSHAPSGLLIYRGEAFSEWNGALLSGGLRSQDLRLIHASGDESQIKESRIVIERRVRDVDVGPKGDIFILTDHEDGELLRLSPKIQP
jgi:glucose/arabinose dehydrogenase